ncbi:MAG: putative selenium-dependent hydroxylase accessory protein YqeC [Anaerolineales bacterium]|nr:putative selenium-dependent hydroxylase accessory protein YqeC [Anaerolineales bacterium]
MSLTLAQALRMDDTNCLAFIGSGGKTTALFQLARQLKPPVIVTAASHLGTWQLSAADKHLVMKSSAALSELEKDLRGVVLITGAIEGDRTKPVSDDLLASIHEFCLVRSIPLLIEADGARQKPLKGWAEHEPPIPEFAKHVVQMVGMNGLDKPLTDEYVHRPEIFSKLSGSKVGEIINAEAITKVLLHLDGARRNFPQGARRTVLLNQADTPELQATARGMAQSLLSRFDSVIIAELKEKKICAAHERIAGIVLAAGESSRFGEPKQLLDWRGEPFVHAVARKALDAGLSPVVVVVGANANRVRDAVHDLDVEVVMNEEWRDGQASSIKAGVRAIQPPPPFGHLPQIRHTSILNMKKTPVGFGGGWEGVGAAIFLLVDQPQITASILQALIEKHAEGLYPVIAPMVIDRRANPVLFDRKTFSDLLTLEGDVGGRAIFHKYKVEYLPWHDDRLLLDVDTPEHYQRLLADETL